jgi:hypothetical protein
MGKGIIVEHLGEAHYRIGLDIEVTYARNQLFALQTYLAEFAPAYQEATEKKDAARAALTPINDRLTEYLRAGQEASQAAYDAMVAAYEAYRDAVETLPDQAAADDLLEVSNELSSEFAGNPNAETGALSQAADIQWQAFVGDFLDPAAVQAATDAKDAGISDLITAQEQFDEGDLPEQALTFYRNEYNRLYGEWVTAVQDNSGPERVAALEKAWNDATEAFNKAREDLGKLLNNGGLPEGLATILADQERAYADYHAALADWQSMTLIKAEKEKAAAELQSRLIPYTDGDGQPIKPEVNAWCCDYTEDLTVGAPVATIEIPGERDLAVRVRPGYESRETYDAARDGLLQPSWAGSPEQTYWNWALHPGNARWSPNYRLGEILLIDRQAGTCTVQLDQQTNNEKSKARDGTVLDVNNPIKYQIDPVTGEQTAILPGDNVIVDGGITTLTDVPIEYMECNSEVFEVGDRVMVEFQGRDWTAPKVIGFAETPRPCIMRGLILQAHLPDAESEYLTLADTPFGTLGQLKHANNVTDGGNLDWVSTDGKDLVTWQGPPGRAIATQIVPGNVPYPSGFSADSPGAKYRVRLKFDSATTQSPVDPLWTITQHFSNTLWVNGRTSVNAPAGSQILGAAICASGAKKYLVAVWTGIPNGADLLPHETNLAAFDVLEHPAIADHVFAFAPLTGSTVGAWVILHTEALSAGGDVFPPIGAYFFSASGTKCAACVPTFVEDSVNYGTVELPFYGIGNDLIIRAEFVPGPDGVTLTGPSITRQSAQASAYAYSFIFTGTGGPDSGPWSYEFNESESNNSSAVLAVDFDGEAEVTLSGTASFSLTNTGSGAGVSDLFAPEGDSGSRNLSEAQIVTWSVTDSSRAIVCDYSYSRAREWGEGWSFSGGLAWSGSDSQTADASVRRLMFYDLRNGAALYHVASGNRSYADSHSGTITTPGEGPRLSSGTETGNLLALYEDRDGGAHGAASVSMSDDYTTNEGFVPFYYGAGVSASLNDQASGGKTGESVCNLARAEYQTEWAETAMPQRTVRRLPGIDVQRCNSDGDIVGRIEYRAFPRVDSVIDAALFAPFDAEREHAWDSVFCTAFDIDQAWQNHLTTYHPPGEGEEPITQTALEADLTPKFRR